MAVVGKSGEQVKGLPVLVVGVPPGFIAFFRFRDLLVGDIFAEGFLVELVTEFGVEALELCEPVDRFFLGSDLE